MIQPGRYVVRKQDFLLKYVVLIIKSSHNHPSIPHSPCINALLNIPPIAPHPPCHLAAIRGARAIELLSWLLKAPVLHQRYCWPLISESLTKYARYNWIRRSFVDDVIISMIIHWLHLSLFWPENDDTNVIMFLRSWHHVSWCLYSDSVSNIFGWYFKVTCSSNEHCGWTLAKSGYVKNN